MVSSVRPFSVRTGPQKDYDKYIGKESLEFLFTIFDNSDTESNLEINTFTDNTVVLGVGTSLQLAILGLEKLFKVWKSNGINITVDANNYSLYYYFRLFFLAAINDTMKSTYAYTDIQIDVNAVPAPDEPHIEEWMQRLGGAAGLVARQMGVPGVNRLWDSNGDTYQQYVLAAVMMLEWLGGYIGALANSVVFLIQYAKQFNHRLSDISIGKDSPLPNFLSYLDDPSGITPGGVFADHNAVLDVSGLPNSTETIKSMLMHSFKISNFGMNYGRTFYGYGKRTDNMFVKHFVHLFGFGSDSLASDVFIGAPSIAALIHLWSLYTDAVNAMSDFLNHPHNSWANLKSYADQHFSDSGLSKFGGYAEDVYWPLNNFYQLVDNTVSNGLYTNLARMDEAGDVASDILESLINVDASESLFIDMMGYDDIKKILVFFMMNSMELNALTIAIRKTYGLLMINSAAQIIAWVWDADNALKILFTEGHTNVAQATIEGIFDIKISTKPLTLSAGTQDYVNLLIDMPSETTEVEYINHHNTLGVLLTEILHGSKTKVKEEIIEKTED